MENKMTSYKVVKCDSMEKLEKEVIILIHGGWKPIGGVEIIKHSFTVEKPQLWYFQSMVDYK